MAKCQSNGHIYDSGALDVLGDLGNAGAMDVPWVTSLPLVPRYLGDLGDLAALGEGTQVTQGTQILPPSTCGYQTIRGSRIIITPKT